MFFLYIVYMYSRLQAWSRGLYLAGIVLALVLVIPTAWFPLQVSKLAAFSAFVAAAAVLFAAQGGMREFLRGYGAWPALAVWALPAAYVLSAAFSFDRSVAWTGYMIEWNTVIFALLAALTFTLASALFRTQRTARLLYLSLFFAIAVAAVFQCIAIVFGPSLPGGTFVDRSVNLVGKWNDLGLLASVLGLFVLVELQMRRSSNRMRAASAVLGLLVVALLAFVNFTFAWVLLLAGAVAVALYSFIFGGRNDTEESPRGFLSRIPWVSAGAAAVAIVFMVWGPFINTSLTSLFPVSALEVRPSYQATEAALTAVREGSFSRTLIGMGPNTFGEIWLAQKPPEVNQSVFWNLDFNVGYSTLLTAFGTTGFLGALAWTLPFMLVVAAALRLMRLSVLNREDRALGLALGLGGLLLWAAMLFYVPSQNILLLALVLAGASFGFLWRQGRPAAQDETAPSRAAQAGILLMSALLVAASVWVGATIGQRALAEAYVGQATVALQAGRVDEALAFAHRAVGVEETGDTLRAQVNAGGAKLSALAQTTEGDEQQLRQQFQDVLQATVATGQKAIALNPFDYRPFLLLGQVYDLLAGLGVSGAYEQASTTYGAAAVRNPNNPAIPLALARLHARAGNGAETERFLRTSLTLKPNYTDAILFLVQLNIANNDLASAVQAANAAVQTAPGIAPLWFQLGLLYYAGGDTRSAIPALEEALRIQNDYANAKYFLGLSYYAQNRQIDALALFEDLARTNPDNAEVRAIIENIKEGRSALDGVGPQQPGEANPTPDRAPIEQ